MREEDVSRVGLLCENFRENEKMFWNEVKREKKGVSVKPFNMKDEDGRRLAEKNEV